MAASIFLSLLKHRMPPIRRGVATRPFKSCSLMLRQSDAGARDGIPVPRESTRCYCPHLLTIPLFFHLLITLSSALFVRALSASSLFLSTLPYARYPFLFFSLASTVAHS